MHSSNRVSGISTWTMHQSTTSSLSQTIWPRLESRQFLSLPIVQTLLPVTFGYSRRSEAVVMRKLMRRKSLWRRLLTHSHKRISMGTSRSCCNGTTSALQPEEITSMGLEFHVSTINKSAHTKKVWRLIVCPSYIYIYIYDGHSVNKGDCWVRGTKLVSGFLFLLKFKFCIISNHLLAQRILI